MNEQIGLGAFGTFGEPFGYQQVFFFTTALHGTLDLNTNAIEIYPGSELYAVKREMADGVSSVCYCLYSYAKEPNSNRGGTFIGTCVVVNNGYLKGEAIYSLLKELHTDVVSNPKNIVDHTLQVQKAAQLVVTEPASFNRIKTTISSINAAKAVPIDTQSKFLIQAPADRDRINPVVAFFDTATIYFTHTDTLYFTADERIVAYATEKGIIPVVKWDTFQDYKKQIIQQHKEAAKKAEVIKKEERNQLASKNVKIPVKSTINKSAPSFGLLEPWTNVDGSMSKEAFYQMVQNHNNLLTEYLKLSQQQVATLPVAGTNSSHSSETRIKPRPLIKRKHLMLTIIVLFVLLIATSILLLIRPASNETVVTNTPIADSVAVQSTIVPPSLSPASNTELVKADVVKLVKDSIKGKKLAVIVDLLFIRNPRNIGEVYVGQKEAYAASLLHINENCFTKDSTESVCRCDTLNHIPAFKK